jgi:hypothetical protein
MRKQVSRPWHVPTAARPTERDKTMPEPPDPRDLPEVEPVDEYEDNDYVRKNDLGDDPALRLLLPVGRSGWAIAAGYLGLISVLCFPAPLALLFGILALREMRRNPRKHGLGRAIFGIVMGVLGTLGLILVVIAMIGAATHK